MALFGKKEPCAICGGKVKALFPWKVEGHLVCNECHGVVDLPQDMEKNMTLDEFRGYLAFREENSQLAQQFQTTQKVDFGWLDDKFLFDHNNGYLSMAKNLDKTIFEAKQIKSFAVYEDSTPLFEGSVAGLACHTSTVPQRVMEMAPMLNQMRMQHEMQRNAEDFLDMLDGDRNSTRYHTYSDIPEPFEKFIIEIQFDHPYWSVYTADLAGPTFDNTSPDANDYLRDYEDKVNTMQELARALMALAFPGAPEQYADTAQASAPATSAATVPVDAVTEIQRFKKLLDQGILTEEEFAAKKRQLLGI